MISWKQADHDTGLLLEYLKEYLQKHETEFRAIAAVSRGGMVPGSIVAYALGITDVGTICVTSYQKRKQIEPRIKHDLAPTIAELGGKDGKHLLVVDDLADGGETIRVIRERYPRATCIAPYVKSKKEGIKVLDAWAVQIPGTTWYAFPWSKREKNSAVEKPKKKNR
jgi:xanthine phosphoribosyltransferase